MKSPFLQNRRNVLQLALLAGSGMLFPSAASRKAMAQDTDVSVQPLNDSLALFTGAGCNVLVKKAGNGELLVIDGGLAGHAKQLRRAIERHFDGAAFSMLINTHWHPEQTGLNLELGDEGVTIFAHENTRQWLSTPVKRLWEDRSIDPLPEFARPNETFYHYGSFNHGGERVDYGYLRQAHTDGDMYVYLPADNVMHAGGVIASDGWPFMDWWTGGWIGGVVNAIEILLSQVNDATVIVPASGPAIDKAELMNMRDMYADIFTRVRGMFVAANTVEQTVAAKPAAAYEVKYGNADRFIELAHWSLIPHLTPDA